MATVTLTLRVSYDSGYFTNLNLNETEVLGVAIAPDHVGVLEASKRSVERAFRKFGPLLELGTGGRSAKVLEDVHEIVGTRREVRERRVVGGVDEVSHRYQAVIASPRLRQCRHWTGHSPPDRRHRGRVGPEPPTSTY